MATVSVGLKGQFEVEVTDSLTAESMGSGGLTVYATPALVAALERAAVAAIEAYLGEDETSVGTYIELVHIAASPLGAIITAEAEVTAIDGRQLLFTVTAHDEHELIGKGSHRRVIVKAERFMQKVSQKQA